MVPVFTKLVCRGVFSVGKPWPRVPLFLSFHARGAPTIMLRTFITIENPSGASKVKARMFITVYGPPEDGEGISVLIDCNTPAGFVLGISCLMPLQTKLWSP